MTRLDAPAKLTLSLAITGVRGDGYHLIDAEMVSLALADSIEFSPSPSTSIVVDGPFAEGVPTDGSNLIHAALALVGRTAAVRVTKNIPHGGGLGGGSTDAAAVFRWVGSTDLAAAARVGADVPFCVAGGRARVTGIGDIVEPLAHVQRDFTLIIPPVQVSTPLVYRTWDAMGGPTGDLGNDLEPAALKVEPRLLEWRDRIESATGRRPFLAGSGATWFLDGHVHGLDADLPGTTVVLTTTR